MNVWDQQTIHGFGLSGPILMENAARAAYFALRAETDGRKFASALLFAGPGNNGGDAFALARYLADDGLDVHVMHSRPLDGYTGDAAYHLKLAQAMHIPCTLLQGRQQDFPQADLIVDGLLGTGIQGELRPDMRGWISAINEMKRHAFVLALDIPSGLSGLSGEPMPLAVRADLTVTFEAAKLGLALPAAAPYTGKLVVSKIGIPRQIKEKHPATHAALTAALVHALPEPRPDMHKGDSGHVLVLGGSQGMTGAPLLAARAALRSGAGLVTLGCPRDPAATYGSFPEIMTLGLGSHGDWDDRCYANLAPHLTRFSTVVLGPGFGRSSGGARFLESYMNAPHPKTLYDADALYLLAQNPKLLKDLGPDAVLTPHPGEMGFLLGMAGADVNRNRLAHAREFAAAHGCVLVLKGAGTIVAGPENPVTISPFSAPNLAVAGSGDVLAGVIGSLMAQNLEPLTAAQAGVYWHGYTGLFLAKDFPYRGNTPLDIAEALPAALKEWIQCAPPKTS
jgi:NAD(P)H-hydrate epimerase